jgi:hypothetical protein
MILVHASKEDPSAKKPQDDLKWDVILNPWRLASFSLSF